MYDNFSSITFLGGNSIVFIACIVDTEKLVRLIQFGQLINPKINCLCSMKEGSLGEDDLHVSLRKSDFTWAKPVNMGNKINSKSSENRPYISPDSKYFFFTSTKSGNRDIYWVDAKIIEELKTKNQK